MNATPKVSVTSKVGGFFKIPLWLGALAAAGVAIVSGVVPLTGVESVSEIVVRTSHILVFLAAITVVADLCSVAGLFEAVGRFVARISSGRTLVMFVGISVLGLFTTTVLSLDTTAVLLTPVVIHVARHTKVAVLPFVMAVVWLANAGSLILPVSNLTNLLAMHRLETTPLDYLRIMWFPGLVAAIIPIALLAIVYRKSLRVRFTVPERRALHDPVLVWICGAVVVSMLPAIIAGLPVEYIALVGLTALIITFVFRKRTALNWTLVPWRLVVLTISMFVAMTGLGNLGGAQVASSALGAANDLLGLLRTTFTAAIASNVFNNLPAYLLLERALPETSREQLFAVLIGVNVGPGILLHGSLATILWWDRCRKEGVEVSWTYFAAFGLVCVPLTLIASTVSLWSMLR